MLSLCLLGAWLRCTFAANMPLSYLGKAIFSLLSSFFYMLPPLVSAAWFRPETRVTITGLQYGIAMLGCLFGLILPPIIVHPPPHFHKS